MVTRTRTRTRTASRSTNRNKLTAATDYTLPRTGSLLPHIERLAQAVEEKTHRLKYSGGDVLADGDEMLEEREADLRRFREQRMPITDRHFELIEVFRSELGKLGVLKRIGRGRSEQVSEDVAVAMENVRIRRNAVATRATANGIPLNILDISRAYGSPRALYNAATEAADAIEQFLLEFDDETYARKLIADFRAAIEEMGELAGVRTRGKINRSKEQLRKRLLVRALYRYLLWFSKWGIAAAGDDPEALRRWRLDKTFPNQAAAKKTVDEQILGRATVPADDPDDPEEG